MAHRPYPSIDRALHQIGRHYPDAPVIPMSPAMQSAADGFLRISGGLQQAAQRAGTYVLSTRRPPVSPEVASCFPSEFIEQVNQPRRPGIVSGPS